jgi:4-alpha-glucanotransferase
VQRRYRGSDKQWHTVSDESVAAVLQALGADTPRPAERPDDPIVIVAGESRATPASAFVALEDGSERPAGGALPADLPLGYHRLVDGVRSRLLVVTPPRCFCPDDLRIFGLVSQLYATRSRRSWGIGDLGDLALTGRLARGLGARMLLSSPLHAVLPLTPVQASPYSPTSRLYRNPLHLDVMALPGADAADLGDLARQADALNRERRIDRDAVARLKLAAVERIVGDSPPPLGEADTHMAHVFGLFCALAERHGGDWRMWPAELHDPQAAMRTADEPTRLRARLHAWMQALLDVQLEHAAAQIPLMIDLAIGCDPGGFDGWIWQDHLAPGISVGAPPDTFNTQGQDWGLPAFVPWKMQAAEYAPFIATIRANLRHARGLRIDHVMGLSRLWWVPGALGAKGGAYVRYPAEDLLGIVALESVRSQAIIVGEDLGTVEKQLKVMLRERGFLTYRLFIFEDAPPGRWPRQAMAAVTTHDLPTIAGIWDGSDLARQEALGLQPNVVAEKKVHARVARGLGADATAADAVVRVHERLGRSQSMVVAATLEDLAEVAERPNQPGTVGGNNWSMALPQPVEDLLASPMGQRVAGALAQGR